MHGRKSLGADRRRPLTDSRDRRVRGNGDFAGRADQPRADSRYCQHVIDAWTPKPKLRAVDRLQSPGGVLSAAVPRGDAHRIGGRQMWPGRRRAKARGDVHRGGRIDESLLGVGEREREAVGPRRVVPVAAPNWAVERMSLANSLSERPAAGGNSEALGCSAPLRSSTAGAEAVVTGGGVDPGPVPLTAARLVCVALFAEPPQPTSMDRAQQSGQDDVAR